MGQRRRGPHPGTGDGRRIIIEPVVTPGCGEAW